MPRPTVPCAECGKPLFVGRGSLPDPVCHSCRRAAWPPCTECGSGVPCRGNVTCSSRCAADRRQRLTTERRGRKKVWPAKHTMYQTYRWQVLRREILERDGWECQICGLDLTRFGKPSVDHIEPFALRPDLAWDPDNLRAACLRCNCRRSNDIRREVRRVARRRIRQIAEVDRAA